ncbi:sigma 54-interacting transcriptional regulator [Clostridium sp. AWRP]|uniref:sigma-54 interaction domain-containing protein n=1 Tax=Clostridium sp. AWRP TaxID=2212991 RepID=UPI0015868DF1|nr:sigma 54-interacting transcriptional regulator [Clostridium sp. AWRP]
MSNKIAFNTNFNSIDSLSITDSNGKIVYLVRYNPRFGNDKGNTYDNIIDKNILEAYPSLSQETSTVFQCIKKSKPIYKEGQKLYDNNGNPYFTENLTIPIIRSGKIVGTVELSKDITSIKDIENVSLLNNINKHKYMKISKEELKYSFDDIITVNDKMIENIKKGKLIADSPSSVLVYGETGTGKELFVQSIHNFSKNSNKPFVVQNCAAIPETLFESTFFGTTQGAYTGATNKSGLFEQADGGTLFLDEINSMPLHLQTKLLRVLQDGCIRRIGDIKDKKVNVRIMAAMNEDPKTALNKRHIRKDLFYRLGVITIKLIPLRDRKEDIPLLINYFLNYYNKIFNKKVAGITNNVGKLLYQYDWPGNIRELQHVIESSINLISDGYIDIKHLPIYFSDLNNYDDLNNYKSEEGTFSETMNFFEKEKIKSAMKISNGNITKSAKLLKIPRQTLQYKIKKYKLANK